MCSTIVDDKLGAYGKKKKLEFNNRAIRNHKATFISSTGKTKDRDCTPFNIAKTAQYKGLYLC